MGPASAGSLVGRRPVPGGDQLAHLPDVRSGAIVGALVGALVFSLCLKTRCGSGWR